LDNAKNTLFETAKKQYENHLNWKLPCNDSLSSDGTNSGTEDPNNNNKEEELGENISNVTGGENSIHDGKQTLEPDDNQASGTDVVAVEELSTPSSPKK